MVEFDADFLAKMEAIRAGGVEPYPTAAGLAPTERSDTLQKRYLGQDSETIQADPASRGLRVAGRVLYRNRMGKSLFIRIQDAGDAVVVGQDPQSGEPVVRDGILQLYAKREQVGDALFDKLKTLDIGDWISASGDLMRTHTGELSLVIAQARLASKTLLPFPDRFHGVDDVETRSRQRYVDLFVNGDTRRVFRKRSQIVRFIREFLEERGFLEVETPMMHVIPGGATAKPFITHHNALNMDLFLRVAPELYLKRLLVGGLDRVFEINRNFRNEGISVRHNPEFTMLEFYQAWATYKDLIELTQTLFSSLAEAIVGSTQVPFGEGTISFAAPFRCERMGALVAEVTGLEGAQLRDPAAFEAWWRKSGVPAGASDLPKTWARWWEFIFETFVEPKVVDPLFVTHMPAEISPLARRSDDDPELTDRFELYIHGWEISNAFTELNDPVDQAARFARQVAERDAGDDEAMYFDADYIRALSYAMPPAAGQGIGIDRLVMLLTNRASIREVILFPTLRPEARDDGPT